MKNINRTPIVTLVLAAFLSSASADEVKIRPYESFTKPFRVIEVAAAESGRVASVNVQRGDTVESGQTLLQLDSQLLEAARRVAAAEAAGTAKIDGLTVEHELQQRRLRQFEVLAAEGRGSAEELHRAKADEQIALANLRAAQELKAQQQLKLAEIETHIATRTIVSPIQGIVTEVKNEAGEFVSAAAPQVVTVVDLTQLRAAFFLPTEAAAVLNKLQTVRVYLLHSKSVVSGTVEHVGMVTEADSGRVRVDVVIDNRAQQLRSGIRCRLLLDEHSDAPSNETAEATGVRQTR